MSVKCAELDKKKEKYMGYPTDENKHPTPKNCIYYLFNVMNLQKSGSAESRTAKSKSA